LKIRAIKSVAVPEKNLAAPIASPLSLRNGDESTAAAPSAEMREITNVISSNAQTLACSQNSHHQRNLDIITFKARTKQLEKPRRIDYAGN